MILTADKAKRLAEGESSARAERMAKYAEKHFGKEAPKGLKLSELVEAFVCPVCAERRRKQRERVARYRKARGKKKQ